ncbi:MAG: hypothetical protein FWE90_13450, partial [Defluviitaleaceae bacterium]|nr:hypothetical protein [Defluviitaleaceae bacterium]MCL2501322.1 hypothetical protein [Defluviitaleaceae bacterium]
NLRYMMEEVLNGMVDSTRAADGTRLALFSAPHAEGPIVNITIEGAYPNARVIAMVGLTPIPVAARVIDGSWYVNVQAFAQLFGFMPEVN